MPEVIAEIDVGDTVVCDWCNADYTGSDQSGGLIVAGRAVCPRCEKECRERLKEYGEEADIEAECPSGVSFQAFVLGLRRSNKITIEVC